MAAFNAQSTTDEVIAGVDLSGKTALVTGASAGLGTETCRVLAGAGAHVVMLARDQTKLDAAAHGIRQANPEARLETQLVDLADLDSVTAAGETLLTKYPAIDLLIDNAGVMACPQGRTAQGFELQFGTNHLGHFLLTCLLAPALVAGAPSRVVVLSSGAHKMSGVDFDDINYERRDYEKWQAYGQSKTANALFAVALDKRLSDRGVRVYSVHPGMILTELGRHLDESDIKMLMASAEDTDRSFKTIPQGAATQVYAATSADLVGEGGMYMEDCGIARRSEGERAWGVEAHAADSDVAERLWRVSEEMVGRQFAL